MNVQAGSITEPSETDVLLYEIACIVQEEMGQDEVHAQKIALSLMRGFRRRWGGSEIYFPSPDKTARDAAIRAEFNGCNRKEICERYGISPSRFYTIIGKR